MSPLPDHSEMLSARPLRSLFVPRRPWLHLPDFFGTHEILCRSQPCRSSNHNPLIGSSYIRSPARDREKYRSVPTSSPLDLCLWQYSALSWKSLQSTSPAQSAPTTASKSPLSRSRRPTAPATKTYVVCCGMGDPRLHDQHIPLDACPWDRPRCRISPHWCHSP